LDFSVEKYGDIISDLDRLYALATDEVVGDCPFKVNVDHDQFIAMEGIDLLRVITARVEGELAGFHIATITSDIFYKDKMTSYVLHYFIMKEHRGNGKGLRMFEYAEQLNKENNIDRCFMSRKVHINNEKLFIKLGYTNIESNYEKYYE